MYDALPQKDIFSAPNIFSIILLFIQDQFILQQKLSNDIKNK
jgi:hypothetical protein